MIIPPIGGALGAVLITLVGAAQLTRTPAEQVTGILFIVAAGVWGETVRRQNSYAEGVAMGGVAIVLAARAAGGAAGVVVQTGWSGAIIIVATWGGLASLFAYSSWLRLSGRRP